jgi:hypothetical protein
LGSWHKHFGLFHPSLHTTYGNPLYSTPVVGSSHCFTVVPLPYLPFIENIILNKGHFILCFGWQENVQENHHVIMIDGVMVIMLTSSVVDHGVSPSQVKPKTIKLVFVVSLISMQHQWVRARTGWLRIIMMCPSERHVYLLFQGASTIYKSNSACWPSTKQMTSSNGNLTSSCHGIAEILLIWCLNTITQS